MNKKDFVKYVDHSLLKPQLTYEEVVKGLEFAKEQECASVCVSPVNVNIARQILGGTKVNIGTVIGFPLGTSTTRSKAAETEEAYSLGAVEMDMVINIGALKSGDTKRVKEDIQAVVEASPAIVKVILETFYLTKEEIVTASQLVEEAGAHYVKTSTGFAAKGALIEDIKLMKKSVSRQMKIKAAGGIKTLEQALRFIEAGSDRIGISATKEMIKLL